MLPHAHERASRHLAVKSRHKFAFSNIFLIAGIEVITCSPWRHGSLLPYSCRTLTDALDVTHLMFSLCRHRLVVPKYNPARTTTPEGAVGLGGAYLCIYPMDSPGGYQLVGRTLPIWSTFGRVGPFTPAKPWLLRYFDQVQLCWQHSVSHHTSAALIGQPVNPAKPYLLRRHQCCSLS